MKYIVQEKKNKSIIISTVVLVYPFLPLLKEWNGSLGLFIEAVLLVLLFVSSILKDNNIRKARIHGDFIFSIIFLIIYFLINIDNLFVSLSGFRCFLMYFLLQSALENSYNKLDYKTVIAANYAMLTSLVMSAGCIIQFIFPEIIKSCHNPVMVGALRSKTDWTPFGIYNRAISFMMDPNVLSVFLAFVFFITFDIYQKYKNKKYVFLIVVELISIVLTQSRTGIFTVIVFIITRLLVTLFISQKLTKRKLLIFSVIIVSGIYIMFVYGEQLLRFIRIDTILNGNGRVLKNNKNLSDLFLQGQALFFGNGLFDGRQIIFENSYLVLIYMFGVLGTLIFLAISARKFRNILKFINIEYMVSYMACCMVGDYILIPQITMMVIIGMSLRIVFRENKVD